MADFQGLMFPTSLAPTPSPVVPDVTTQAKDAIAAAIQPKMQAVAAMSEGKKALLGQPQPFDTLAVAGREGNALSTDNEYLADLERLGPYEVQQKYGEQGLTDKNNLVAARNRVNDLADPARLTQETLPDTVNSIGSGLGNGIGGAAALLTGLVDPNIGNYTSSKLADFNQMVDEHKSPALQQAEQYEAIASDLDSQDRAAQFKQDMRAGDGRVVSELKKFGRGAVDSIARAVNNPLIAGDMAASGVGSLLALGPISKGANVAGKLAGLGEKAIEKVSTVASIGALESGGSYVQTQQQIMGMSHEDLLKGSDQYRELVASGVDPEQAKIQVANKGGLISAAVTLPAALIAGKLVDKFEAAPFVSKSLGESGANIVKEGAEEFIQNPASQIATNYAVQQTANPNQDLTEGAGEAAGQGLIGGIASAGATQAPAMVIHSAATVAKPVVDAVTKGVDELGRRTTEANAKASPVAPDKVTESVTSSAAQVNTVVQDIQSKIPETATPKQKEEVNQYTQKVLKSAVISPEEKSSLPPLVQAQIGDSTDRFQSMLAAAFVAKDKTQTDADRTQSAIYVLDQLNNNEGLFNEDLPSALKESDGSAEHQQLTQYNQVLQLIRQHPEISGVLNNVKQMRIDNAIPASQVTPQIADNVAGVATYNPIGVNPETAKSVLHQADIGNVQLDPAKRQAIVNSVSLVQAAQDFAATMEEMGASPKGKTPQEVHEQIVGASLDANYPSMNDHLGRIAESLQRGDNKLARKQAQRLMQFAKHMSSKVHALNMSYDQGKPVAYSKDAPALTVHRNKAGSILNAQTIYAEAKAVVQVANSVAQNLPEFGIHQTPVISLRPALRKPAQEAVQQPKAEAKPIVQEEVKAPVEAPVAEPKVVNEPVQKSEPKPVEETVSEGTKEEQAPVAQKAEANSEPVRSQSSKEDATPLERTVASTFPTLLKDKAKSFFHSAFKLAKEPSRLFADKTPVATLRDILANRSSLTAFLGESPRYGYDAKLGRAYADYLTNAAGVLKEMRARLKTFYTEPTKYNKKQTTRLDLYSEGVTFADGVQGRALNIVDPDRGGYDPTLVQNAILAGLHWALNAQGRTYEMDKGEVAGAFSISEDDVTKEIMDFMNDGVSLSDAKRQVAKLIQDFWGVTPNNSEQLGYVKGIPEGVAAEVLRGMAAQGLLSYTTVTLPNKETPIRVSFKDRPKAVVDQIKALDEAPHIIADVFLKNNPDDPHIGEPLDDKLIPDYQMRNPLVQNTRQQKQVISRANKVAYYVNNSAADFVYDMTEDEFVDLFGGMSALSKNTPINQEHRKSVEGINSSLRNSYRDIARQLAMVENRAIQDKVDRHEVPIYYEHNMSRVSRLHMLGAANPQANVHARQIFVSTNAQLDLTNQEHNDAFWLTVAQALGKKTELKYTKDVIAETQKALEGELKPALNIIRDWMDGNRLTKEDQAVIRNLTSQKSRMKAIDAFIAVNKYMENPQNTEFNHSLALEADGKTDGPINALVHFTAGLFTADWLDLVEKGGLFIGSKFKTLNEYYNSPKAVDLYEAATQNLKKRLAALRAGLVGDPVKPNMDALLTIMGALLGDVEFKDGELTLKRGIAKNPLTIRIYGSGVDGIAGDVTDAITEEIYKAMTLSAESSQRLGDVLGMDNKEFSGLLNILINQEVRFSKKKGLYVIQHKSSRTEQFDPITFKFSKDERDNLKSHVRNLFVRELDASINEMLGESQVTTTRVQKSIQIQSIVLASIFKQEVQKRLDKLSETGTKKKVNFLSQNDLNEIYEHLAHYAPVVRTGTQEFFVGGTENTDVGGVEAYSKDILGGSKTDAFVYAPKDAGVGGIPYIVIGTGDGQMVQNIFSENDWNNILAVFDGIEMPASQIKPYSEKINKAVFDGWMMNPVGSVAKSYQDFVRTNPFDLVENDPEGSKALRDAIYGKDQGDGVGFQFVKQAAQEIGKLLTEHAKQIQARHAVMAKVGLHVDHMASAQSPYENKGIQLPTERAARVEELNRLYRLELARLSEGDPVEPVDTKVLDLSKLGMIDGDSGARVVSAKELPQLPLTNPSHAEFVRQAAKVIPSLSVVFGTVEQIERFERNNDPNFTPDKMGFGKYNADTKTIYIVNASSETIVHELIHATTFAKVSAHYAGSVLPSEEAEAIKRLEGLMGEFLNSTYSNETVVARSARAQAESSINEYINKGDTASAVNEFMAWSLANANLASVQSETKVLNPLFAVARKAVQMIKDLFWGGKGPKVGEDLWSNVRFNTRILMATPSRTEQIGANVLHQSSSFGSNQDLADLHGRILKSVDTIIPPADIPSAKEYENFVHDTLKFTETFRKHGWFMTQQQASVFQSLVALFGAETRMNTSALSQVQEMYAHVMKTLKVEDLMENPKEDDIGDRYIANERYKLLNGEYGIGKDPKGVSSLMPAFLALAMTNDQFRKALSKISPPKSEADTSDSKVDRYLNDKGNQLIDNATKYLAGQEGDNARDIIHSLTEVLIHTAEDDRSFIEKEVTNGVNKFETYLDNSLQAWSGKVAETADKISANTNSKFIKAGAQITKLITGIINDDVAEAVQSSITSILNRNNVFTPLRELFADLSGRTKSNAPVFDMITKVRSIVQQTRQQFREQLPEKIASHFSRKLTDLEWTHMFKGLGKTDISSLVSAHDMDDVLKMLKSKSFLAQTIKTTEVRLQGLDPINNARILKKIDALATYLTTGVADYSLLRNAYAIANLFGEGGRKSAASEQLIDTIDQLVTLRAIEKLNPEIGKTLSSLVQNEKEGLTFTIAYLGGQRQDEMLRVTNGNARANHYKGYVPSENTNGQQLIIANDDDYTKLIPLGFERVGDYKGSDAEGRGTKRGYYYAPVSGRAAFNQGILQTVRSTASGVDPVTGQTVATVNAGVITDVDQIARISKRMSKNTGSEVLLPVFNDDGEVIAFERSADPRELARLSPNTHLGEMLGAWKGRQVEEAFAREFNKQLIDNLADIWNQNKALASSSEFVDLSEVSKDPIINDAWKIVTPEMKEYIKEVFGGDGFRVRKDMLNDTIGYRSASVGDAWTGNTRWNDNVTKLVRNVATEMMGNKAFPILTKSEKFIQDRVVDAKQLIVVKSIVVPVSNMISNMFQLLQNGIPIRDVLKGVPAKTIEVNAYIKNRSRQIELETEVRVAKYTKDIVKERKLQTEWQTLQDANKRLSIWKLIEDGEFTSISEGGVTQEDLALANGRWVDYMETLASKVPGPAQTVARYALITKDTALYKGLARATQYGDFIAKAIMYDHLTKTKKMDKHEAVQQVSEHFINYNRLAGRGRQYLESIGLLWFWNYKIRAVKAASYMIRRNPLRAFMAGMEPSLPILGDVGSPVTDNILVKALDGSLGYSIGPGQGLNAPFLNPWMQLMH